MGMYTEICIQAETLPNLPEDVVTRLKWVFSEERVDIDYSAWGNIPYWATLPRADMLGNGCSYYHHGQSVRSMSKGIADNCGYFIFMRCDIKNYDGEIEEFLKWLILYLNPARPIQGWVRYEEDEIATPIQDWIAKWCST